MNVKAEECQERSSKGLLGVCLCWLAVIVMLYVLSLGPVMLMVQNKSFAPGSRTFGVLYTFYQPIELTARKIPVVAHSIGMYLHLWVPKMFDRKGNRIG